MCGTSGQVNKIDVVGLRNKRHGSRGAKIALDDLDLVVFANELHVEGARYLQCPAELLASLFHSPVSLDEKLLRWQQQRGVATVDTRVLTCSAIA